MAEIRRYKGKTSELFTRVLAEPVALRRPLPHRRRTCVFVSSTRSPAEARRSSPRWPPAMTPSGSSRRDATSRRPRRSSASTAARLAFRTRPSTTRRSAASGSSSALAHDQRLLVLAQGDAREADFVARRRAGRRPVPRDRDRSALRDPARRRRGHARARGAPCLGARAASRRSDALWPGTRPVCRARSSPRSSPRNSGLTVRDDGPYAELEHRVDRVIKRRDVLVAVKPVRAYSEAVGASSSEVRSTSRVS